MRYVLNTDVILNICISNNDEHCYKVYPKRLIAQVVKNGLYPFDRINEKRKALNIRNYKKNILYMRLGL